MNAVLNARCVTVHSLSVALMAAVALAAAGSASATPTAPVTGIGLYPTTPRIPGTTNFQTTITYEGTVAGAGAGPYTLYSPNGTGVLQLNINNSSTTIYAYDLSFDQSIGACLGVQQCNAPVDHLAPGTLTQNGTGGSSLTGAPISLTVSEEIQTLIDQGAAAEQLSTHCRPAVCPSADLLESYQIAILDLEYGLTQNTGDATPATIADIASDIAYAEANPASHAAYTLYDPTGVTATLGTTIAVPAVDGLGGGTPEPAAWVMMLVGFGALGGVVRRNRRALAA